MPCSSPPHGRSDPRGRIRVSTKNGARTPLVAWMWLMIAGATFALLSWRAWEGKLGAAALGLLTVAAVAFFAGRRQVPAASRKSLDTTAKALFTVVGCTALLRHPIDAGMGVRLPIYQAIARYIDKVDARTFRFF